MDDLMVTGPNGEGADPGSLVQALHETYGWPLLAIEEPGAAEPAAWAVRRPDGLLDFGYGVDRAVPDGAVAAFLAATGDLDPGARVTLSEVGLASIIALGSGALDGREPLAAAQAEVARVYRPRWPFPQPLPSEPLMILVHPGSACGSADDGLGKADGHAAREGLIFELADWDGHLVVIHGELSDELARPRYAPLGRAIDEAVRQARANGRMGAEMWGCDNGDLGQEDAARRLLARIAVLPMMPILVTGCWASQRDSGCVNSVARILAESGCGRVTISDYAVHEPEDEPEDEPDGDDLEWPGAS